jgi:non-homologous end joining protein Ku
LDAALCLIRQYRLSRRERMVVVEPRGTGMALVALRAAEEVRATEFGIAEGELLSPSASRLRGIGGPKVR